MAHRVVRLATAADLKPLMALYLHLNPERPDLPDEVAGCIMAEILEQQHLFVAEVDGLLVASCMLAINANLMRGGRPYAVLENVVTDAAFQRQGHGQAVVAAALDTAWAHGARMVTLMSGRPSLGVQAFYESCGFALGLKTGYVAMAPDEGQQ